MKEQSENTLIHAAMHRRNFLTTSTVVGGAMVLGFSSGYRPAQAAGPIESWSRDSMVPELTPWIVIAPDDTVTIRINQIESGQGIWTAVAMIIAEELQCDWSKVRAEYASPNRDAKEKAPTWTLKRPGNGKATDPASAGGVGDLALSVENDTVRQDYVYRRMTTNGSNGIKQNQYYLQMAGAEGRERLLMAAADLWKVPKTELVAKDSVITHTPSGRKTTYGKVAQKAASITLPANFSVKLKGPGEYTLIGTDKPNLTTQYHVTGQTQYGIDIKVPGTLYAAAKAGPVFGSKVKSYDFNAIKGRPGVHSVVKFAQPDVNLTRGKVFSEGVAVIADTWWHAKTAMDVLPIEWDAPADALKNNTPDMYKALAEAIAKPGKELVKEGDYDGNMAKAAKVVEGKYAMPYNQRARMEPGNATVLVTDSRVDMWIGDQSPQETRYSASKITGLPMENVYMHLCHIGGGFGRGGNGPQAEQALMIANQVKGRPIHMMWTREEDWSAGTSYRPMSIGHFKAGLDANGFPIAMETKVAMDLGGPGANSNIESLPYFIPGMAYRHSNHYAKFNIPVGTRRGVGGPSNVFFLESFIDEMAHATGKDTYMYRRELLTRSDNAYKNEWIKALDTAAQMAEWDKPLPKGTARGIAMDDRRGNRRLEGLATIVCQVSTVQVTKSGELKLLRVDTAFDEGFSYINPLAVRKQIEGGIEWGYNDTVHQEMTVSGGKMVQRNFDDFNTARIDESPAIINITTLKTGHWVTGVGEDTMSTISSGVTDAVFRITGKRIRSLPLRNHDLSWG